MNDKQTKAKELLRKIKELAERGEQEEAVSAREKLNELLTKYSIKESDLEKEELFWFGFSADSQYEFRLMQQIYGFLTNKVNFSFKQDENVYWLNLTNAEGLEFNIFYEYYRDCWQRELGRFWTSFYTKHKLFPATTEGCKKVEVDEEDEQMIRNLISGQDSITLQKVKGYIERK